MESCEIKDIFLPQPRKTLETGQTEFAKTRGRIDRYKVETYIQGTL